MRDSRKKKTKVRKLSATMYRVSTVYSEIKDLDFYSQSDIVIIKVTRFLIVMGGLPLALLLLDFYDDFTK